MSVAPNGNGDGRNAAIDAALALNGGNGGLRPRSALAAACDMLPRQRLVLAMEDAELESWFVDSIRAGVRRGDRTAMRIYAEAREIVGTKLDMARAIVDALGVGVQIAKANNESIERAKMLSPRQRLEAHARALREAGWTLAPPADWSDAVEVNGNGHGPSTNGEAG